MAKVKKKAAEKPKREVKVNELGDIFINGGLVLSPETRQAETCCGVAEITLGEVADMITAGDLTLAVKALVKVAEDDSYAAVVYYEAANVRRRDPRIKAAFSEAGFTQAASLGCNPNTGNCLYLWVKKVTRR